MRMMDRARKQMNSTASSTDVTLIPKIWDNVVSVSLVFGREGTGSLGAGVYEVGRWFGGLVGERKVVVAMIARQGGGT